MAVVSIKQLLEAGVHFGHQTKRWNPKMQPYIYGHRNNVYIINLEKTAQCIEVAYNYLKEAVKNGNEVLFVGTKKQAQIPVEEEAKRCGVGYVTRRWLGGTLTNFDTIKNSINKLNELYDMEEKGVFASLSAKEAKRIKVIKERLEKKVGGIRNMKKLPEILFIVDVKKERAALLEARKLGKKVIGMVDTNSDPEEVDYPIPSNDDGVKAIKIICATMANAVLEGKGEKVEIPEEVKEEISKEEMEIIERLAQEYEKKFEYDE